MDTLTKNKIEYFARKRGPAAFFFGLCASLISVLFMPNVYTVGFGSFLMVSFPIFFIWNYPDVQNIKKLRKLKESIYD